MLVGGDVQAEGPLPGAGVTVPCPVLVGRATELETLVGALDDAASGRGGVVFVTGEAGIGKSRLVNELAAVASGRGLRVLRGRAVPGSDAAAFRPLIEALAAIAADIDAGPDLGPWLPALAAIVPTVGTHPQVDITAPVRGEAVLRLLATVCGDGGGVVVLEDLHWADPETLAVVEHLADHLGRVPVLCVATLRSEEDTAARALVRRVSGRRAALVVDLARLNEAQVAAMVYSCTGGAGPDAAAPIVSLADGVPFVIEEMLVSPGLPASLAEGVSARLADLTDPDRRVLLTAAAFGRHFDWRLLGAAADVSEGEVIDALDRGVAAQLLAVDGEGFRFRHALTAEVVFQSVIPPRRQALAASALDALDRAHANLPGDLVEVAARVAERAGRTDRAGELHIRLGEDALRRGALDTAVAALRRAAQLLSLGDGRDVALERLVDALVVAGRVDDALTTGGELAPRLPDARAAAMHLRLAGAAATAARWPVAADHVAAAGGLIDPNAPSALRTELAIREAELALGTGDAARAARRAEDALGIARAEGLRDRECEALQLLGRCARQSSLEDAERWFREALAVADAHGLPVWRLRSLHELGTIGLLARSEVDALLEAQRLAETLGAMATAAVLDIEIAAGSAGDDLDAGIHHGEQAVRRGTELGLDQVVAWGWQHVGVAAALRGDTARADAALAAATAAAPDNRDIEGFVVGARLFEALVADDLERALDLSEHLTEVLRGSETAPPAHHRAAWPALVALARRPEADRAIDEIRETAVAVNPAGRAWLTLAGAIVAGRTDPERAASLALEADREMSHMQMWRSLGRRIAAEAAAADGWTIPAAWLTEAEACLRRLGYPAAADACRRLRGATPAGVPPEWSRRGITRREADVLALVVEGCSNREIAERLYLSVRTVEKHVESLLRKTSTQSRTQLARVAATT